ncbi:hypothetical protein [Endozoicomonas sp. SESOKO4]|nr:hypothetical protein [Endozoicomonas sp. SESOKO4]
MLTASILDDIQSKTYNGDYDALRWYYGYSFLLFTITNQKNSNKYDYLKEYIFTKIDDTDISNASFHWEFNKYALSFINDDIVKKPCLKKIRESEKYNDSKATNWILLNTVCKLRRGEIKKLPLKLFAYLKFRQDRDGFIWDARKVRSSQYHAFSSFLLYEIYKITGSKNIERRFFKSVRITALLTLNSGEFNYLGRGQFQTFGYGPAFYSLYAAYKETGDEEYKRAANLILSVISSNIENDHIPLVLNECSRFTTSNYEFDSLNHIGWYPYNNFIDYSFFLLYFLDRAKDELGDVSLNNISREHILREHYLKSSGLRIVEKTNYSAVFGSVKGFITNGLPIPYLESRGRRCTPVLGGEQFTKSLYKSNMISLPLDRKKKPPSNSFFFNSNSLILYSWAGLDIYRYKITNSCISILISSLRLFKPSYHISLFGKVVINNGVTKVEYENMVVYLYADILSINRGYSASGVFNVIQLTSKKTPIKIDFKFFKK